jgi:hypothetical protein
MHRKQNQRKLDFFLKYKKTINKLNTTHNQQELF